LANDLRRPMKASWPGLTRPSTGFGATNDLKQATRPCGLVLHVVATGCGDIGLFFEAALRGWPGQARP
jgi:hypothetical protein